METAHLENFYWSASAGDVPRGDRQLFQVALPHPRSSDSDSGQLQGLGFRNFGKVNHAHSDLSLTLSDAAATQQSRTQSRTQATIQTAVTAGARFPLQHPSAMAPMMMMIPSQVSRTHSMDFGSN